MHLKPLIAEATSLRSLHHKEERISGSGDDGFDRPGHYCLQSDKMIDTGAKDDLANKVRLITASSDASAVVLIVES